MGQLPSMSPCIKPLNFARDIQEECSIHTFKGNIMNNPIELDNLVTLFHKKRHEDKGFNAFYRSHDFTLWVCDLIKDGTLVVTKKENVLL